MAYPKNDELAMLREAQRSGFTPGAVARKIGASANTAAEEIMRSMGPREPRIAGYDSMGNPLYESLLPFSDPIGADRYQAEQTAMSALPMFGGGMSKGIGALGAMASRRPQPFGGLARQTAEVLPPGNNPFARPGAVVDPAMRPGLPAPRPTVGAPMPNVSGYGKDPLGIPENFGSQFASTKYGPSMSGVGKAALGTGLAGAAIGAVGGAMSPRMPAMQQQEASGPSLPEWLDAFSAQGDQLQQAQFPQQPAVPEQGLAAPRRRTDRWTKGGKPVTQQDLDKQAQRYAQMRAGQPEQPMQGQGQQGGGYWVDLMSPGDSGDAYARDFINLREKARQEAQAAAQRGEYLQFVPLQDLRNNQVHIVNAGGTDIVLDMGDEQDRAEYQRIAGKVGLSPNDLSAWSARSSAPLMGYFERGGGPRQPDFQTIRRETLPSQVR